MLDGDRLDASLARITCLAVHQRIFIALATSLGHYEHCPITAVQDFTSSSNRVCALPRRGGGESLLLHVGSFYIIYNFQVESCFLKLSAKTEKFHEIRRRREVHSS